MSEHDWIENAGEAGLEFTADHATLMQDLDISEGTVRESLFQNIEYNETAWSRFISKNPGFNAGAPDVMVSLGTVDVLDPFKYLEVEFDEGGNLTDQEFQGLLVAEWIPNMKPQDNDTVILIDSDVLGVSYFMKSWLTFSEPSSISTTSLENIDLDEFFGSLGEDNDDLDD